MAQIFRKYPPPKKKKEFGDMLWYIEIMCFDKYTFANPFTLGR